jgi:hypothetical protein
VTRREHRVRPRLPPPYCPASWVLDQEHRATRLGQNLPGALRRTPNLFSNLATRLTFKLIYNPYILPFLPSCPPRSRMLYVRRASQFSSFKGSFYSIRLHVCVMPVCLV